MTFYAGQNGRMKIGSTVAAKVTNWSFSSSMAPLQTTTLEDTDNTFIDGLRTMTGSCRLFYYQDGASNSAKELIDKLVKTRTTAGDGGKAASPDNVILELQVVEGSTVKSMELEVLLTSASMAMSVGEVLSADVAFQVNGAPITNSL